ncbi:hypothetical protein [Capnocytophaga sputigena]|jgi:hypothetical protein|uniref:Uncharacterized protein n=1 Tax=Capnocytophaga sputigena TaxID=1019 RepID=A0A2A3N5H6_CAPSP|nr:hypothetical protein [Capnocytophaga sputigena]ATA79103.1 hypothetical protein CGC59_05130 [Capnocytophaga sputigena]PBN46868.1 hypothetical protein CDC50_12885 [Capnocytophaga sputigena]
MKKTILLLVAIFAMVACGKSDDNKDGGGSGNGNSSGWALKILKSEGVTVGAVVIQYSTGETYTDSSQKPLTKDYVIDIKGGEPMQVAVGATGVNDNSTLTIQLLQNGQVKKTSSSKGTILNASL